MTHKVPGGKVINEHESDRGQAMVEFAMSVGILVLLLILVVVLAFMLYAHVTLSSCAREGARLVIGAPWVTDDEVVEYARRGAGVLDSNLITVTVSPSPEARQPGTNVTVDVSYPFQLVDITVPYILTAGGFRIFPPVWVNATSTMNLD